MVDTAVTAADIARLAGVSRGTVANWRRRHADFPGPTGGTDASPAYDLSQVEAWLAQRGLKPELSLDDLLWRAVLRVSGNRPLGDVVTRTAESIVTRADELRDAVQPLEDSLDIGAAASMALVAQGAQETLRGLLDRYAESACVPGTPRPVAGLMAYLGAARRGTVFDPAAGTGALLHAALAQNSDIDAYGQEADEVLARLAELALHCDLAGAERDGLRVAAGDSLRNDKFAGLRARTVLCHPPFGERDWGQDELAHDPRWEYGVPARSEPELAWVQHALAHLEPGGRAVVLLPPAVASRPSGRRIRAQLLRRGTVRAVIAMPPGAVHPRHVPVHLWVLERPSGNEPADPRVLVVEGRTYSAEATTETNTENAPIQTWADFMMKVAAAWQSYAGESPADLAHPRDAQPYVSQLGAWQQFTATDEVAGHWRILRAIDLLDEAADLSPGRHVSPAEAAVPPSETRDEVRALSGQLRAALVRTGDALPADDWIVGEQAGAWPVVTVSELTRRGMAEFYPGGTKSGAVAPQPGDVLMPATVAGPLRAFVVETARSAPAEPEAAPGSMHIVRPDRRLLDPWFLAGVLASPANVKQASYGTAAIRIEARRLSVPLLPLETQRAYGVIFCQLRELDTAAAQAAALARDLSDLLTRALADGTLVPPPAENDESTGEGNR